MLRRFVTSRLLSYDY